MASKKNSLNEALEDKVLKTRKINDQGTVFGDGSIIIWKISQNSNKHKTDDYFKPKITFKGQTFILLRCHLKIDLDFPDYYKIVLKLDRDHDILTVPENFPELVHIFLSLIDKNKKICNSHEQVTEMNQLEYDIEFPKFIKKDDLFDKNKNFWSNEELTVHCKIYCRTEKKGNKKHQIEVLDDIENLLKSGEFSDMKFIIDSKELKVHKNILSAQSPVFDAMFAHDTQEQRNNSVEIIDVSYETMTEVLRFLYSAKVNNIKKMAKDIFIAADKYEIDTLKMLCEHELIECLSVENISDVLMLVNQYDSEYLKKHAFDFITINAEDLNNRENFHETLDILSLNLLKEINQISNTRI